MNIFKHPLSLFTGSVVSIGGGIAGVLGMLTTTITVLTSVIGLATVILGLLIKWKEYKKLQGKKNAYKHLHNHKK